MGKRCICGILLLLVLLRFALPASAAEQELAGKTLSILGDSISTYGGFSDDPGANATIGGSRLFYPRWGMEVKPEDTWWYQTVERLDMRLLVNNSWSGSCVLRSAHGAEGAYVSRCVQLHNNEGQEPDIIAVYLGTNDYYAYPDTLGTFADINFDLLFGADAQPKTTLEAYAVTLDKIQKRYPNAEVYCFTLLPLADSEIQPTAFNEDIKALAEHFGCFWVDLSDCGISSESAWVHMGDALHPEVCGMDAITAAFVSAILENSRYRDASCKVTYDLAEAVSTGGTPLLVCAGKPFSTELINLSGQPGLDITVTVDGVDITPYCLSGNQISIARTVGDISITAVPTASAPELASPMLPAVLGSMVFSTLQIVS